MFGPYIGVGPLALKPVQIQYHHHRIRYEPNPIQINRGYRQARLGKTNPIEPGLGLRPYLFSLMGFVMPVKRKLLIQELIRFCHLVVQPGQLMQAEMASQADRT